MEIMVQLKAWILQLIGDMQFLDLSFNTHTLLLKLIVSMHGQVFQGNM